MIQKLYSDNAFTHGSFSEENNQTLYDTAEVFGFTKNYQGTSGNLDGPKPIGGHNNHGHLGLVYEDVNWHYVSEAPHLDLSFQ